MTKFILDQCGSRMKAISNAWKFASLLTVALFVLPGSSASADHWHGGVHVYGGHPGPMFYGRPGCVADWYGWPGPIGGWSSGVSISHHGVRYGFGYSQPWPLGWCSGPLFGPAVVRETVIVSPSPVVIADPSPVVIRRRPVRIVDVPPDGPNMADILQQHADRRPNVPLAADESIEIRPVSASSRAGQQRSRQFQAEGDRLVREGNFVKGYLRYLEAEREAQDRADIYFRQSFALVAMGRYSHAVLRLKRGLQVKPRWPQAPTMLDEVYGPENASQKTEFLQRAADWTEQNVRDPDRLFLMGALLHCNADPRSQEFLQAARKWAGREDSHVRAFTLSADQVQVADARNGERPKKLLAPPPPQEEVAPAPPRQKPLPPASRTTPLESPSGLKIPTIGPVIPPEPSPRELILPDPLNDEYVPQP